MGPNSFISYMESSRSWKVSLLGPRKAPGHQSELMTVFVSLAALGCLETSHDLLRIEGEGRRFCFPACILGS